MVFIENPASRSVFPSVSQSAMESQTFVRNLIMRAVNDVLERQGRAALLSYEVISVILNQLTVNVTYEPLKCYSVSALIANHDNLRMNAMDNCLVVSDTVTSICTMAAMADCAMPNNMKTIPQQHFTITGSFQIANIIMASWTDQMWRTILNRVLQVLSAGPFGTNFQAASVNIA